MANVNKVILIGNVTRDVEVKFTPKGTAVAGITLAVNRNYKTDSGEKREEVTFVDVELWGRVAEIAGEYVRKGNPLYVEGRLKQDSWEDKDSGQKRTKLKVVAENDVGEGVDATPALAGDSLFIRGERHLFRFADH